LDISSGSFSDEFDISDIKTALLEIDIDRSVPAISNFTGGTEKAKLLMEKFIENKLEFYGTLRNEPGLNYSSDMSPYLHFGQISPLYIYPPLSRRRPPLNEMKVGNECFQLLNFQINTRKYKNKYS